MMLTKLDYFENQSRRNNLLVVEMLKKEVRTGRQLKGKSETCLGTKWE